MYIGQSQNIYKRIGEHNQRARAGHHGKKDIQLCEKAIRKYGEITDITILEENIDPKNLDKYEKYWIEYFYATNPNRGYNLLDKGDVSGRRGRDHINARFN